ncbi:MAG: calcium-binding protein [Nitrospira sp.]|nr:calcium-binding protein [Nitrospira sp.]
MAIIVGNALPNNLPGTIFADTIAGQGGGDLITGGLGNDTLRGGVGGFGNDVLNGGLGNDTAAYNNAVLDPTGPAGPVLTIGATGAVRVDLNIGGFQNTGGAGFDQLVSIENVIGTEFAGGDTLIGNGVNNVLSGLGGNDCLFGNAGADTLFGGNGNDTLNGGIGADLLNGGLGTDTASYLGGGGAFVNLGTGVTAAAAAGDILISIENLVGSNNNDTLIGNLLNNELCGAAGADVLNGGGGNDVLNGGLGGDLLIGGAGNDTADWSNKIVCGTFVPGATFGVTANLLLGTAVGGGGADTLNGIENLTGSIFGDFLTGNAGANVINGGAGADVLTGGGGRDTLIGGLGNDRFDYNAVTDSLTGAATRDVILGFNGNGAGVGDVIDLSTIDANVLVAGNQAFGLGQLTYIGGILSANVIGTGPAPDLQIDLLGVALNMANDIIL